ncbi:hypothetical protein RND81_06G179000 [Saponaria officinalis]|uniref:S1 motif domain-containing protein n=1 Tax=Saponaria officinalis TaxID=3572 RepID=A0AAW1K7N9_SAPOF
MMKTLNYLSLVSKVCSELDSHVGTSDKVLAEFIIELGHSCENVDQFDAELKKFGAELPDYFVKTLLIIIHAIFPPKSKDNCGSIDGRVRVRELEREIEAEVEERRREGELLGNEDDCGRNRGRGGDRVRRGRYDDRRDGGGGCREEDMESRGGSGSGGRGKRRRDVYEGNVCDEPEMYRVYKGRVSGINRSGCFVKLLDFEDTEGFVHVSEMASRRIADPKDGVRSGTEVYVKLVSKSGQRLSFSMRDVDQNTGEELVPMKKGSRDDALIANPRARLSGIPVVEEEELRMSRRPLKRMSSPEIWETKQLIASGVLSMKELPSFDDEGDGVVICRDEGVEEEIEIELNDDEPAFLRGKTRGTVGMSPVTIFKNTKGSLSSAAALQSALRKDRGELREQQQRAMLDSIPKDLNRPWEDPMPETGERTKLWKNREKKHQIRLQE